MKRKKHYRVVKKQQCKEQACTKSKKQLCLFGCIFVFGMIGAFIKGLVLGYILSKYSKV